MSEHAVKNFVRSPSGAVLIGIMSALILGSFATAGVNTLWMARAMIALSALVLSAYVLRSSLTSHWQMEKKLAVLVGVLAIHLVIERIQTWMQPAPIESRGVPIPPLLLMLPPLQMGYTNSQANVPGLPLSVSYLARPHGGFAGFGKLGDNQNDDVMFGIEGVRFQNLSQKPLRLSWTLHLRGEGKNFEFKGDGKGRWERLLNANDYFATTKQPRLSWLLSPIELPPMGTTQIAGRIGFVAPNADAELRDLIIRGELPAEYIATLTIKNKDTGVKTNLKLPYGTKPQPQNNAMSRAMRETTD
jgi:hypothetical protein